MEKKVMVYTSPALEEVLLENEGLLADSLGKGGQIENMSVRTHEESIWN